MIIASGQVSSRSIFQFIASREQHPQKSHLFLSVNVLKNSIGITIFHYIKDFLTTWIPSTILYVIEILLYFNALNLKFLIVEGMVE